MRHPRRAVLTRGAESLVRHVVAIVCTYCAAAVVSAIAIWVLMIVLSSISWVSRIFGDGSILSDWMLPDSNPLLGIAVGLFIVPLGTVAAAMFMPPIMLVGYPIAVLVARRVADRRLVAAIGAAVGVTLAPIILAIGRQLDLPPEIRTSFGHTYADVIPVLFLPSLAAGATIGWIVALLFGPKATDVTRG